MFEIVFIYKSEGKKVAEEIAVEADTLYEASCKFYELKGHLKPIYLNIKRKAVL